MQYFIIKIKFSIKYIKIPRQKKKKLLPNIITRELAPTRLTGCPV